MRSAVTGAAGHRRTARAVESSRAAWARSQGDLLCEGGRVDGAVDLELEEEPIAASRRERRHELQVLGGGVLVQAGEAAVPQRDEVSLGAEVVLQVYAPAVPRAAGRARR